MGARVLKNRWVRAGAAAVLVAMWPACMVPPDDEAMAGDAAAPDVEYVNLAFTLKDHTGADVDLTQYEGRPVLINFWATWCAPCKVEIPYLVELQDKYRDQGLVVLGISTDDPPEDLVPFVEEFGMNYPVLSAIGRDDMLDAYMAGLVLPESWFVRPDGSVNLKYIGTNTKDWFDEQIQAIVTPAAPEGTR